MSDALLKLPLENKPVEQAEINDAGRGPYLFMTFTGGGELQVFVGDRGGLVVVLNGDVLEYT